MNRMVLEGDCRRCKFDEMSLAEEQIDRVPEIIGASQPFLVVMDRGYLSTAAFIRMMGKGVLFLARLKTSDYKKEQAGLSEPDTWVDIHLDKSRIRHYKGTDIGLRKTSSATQRRNWMKKRSTGNRNHRFLQTL